MTIDYNSKDSIKSCLLHEGLRLSKRFGQNFLLSEHHRKKIIEVLTPDAGEMIWEIGPGIGALTHHLVETPAAVKVFEIDRGFIPILREMFGSYRNFSIVEGDFLKTWREEAAKGAPEKIIGNLPYSVGSVIIGDLIRDEIAASMMVFTLQKEVVDRITASPGTKEYSAFSMLCQYKWRCRKVFNIPKHVFFPVPDVTSAVVTMERELQDDIFRRELYDIFVNDLFLSRRKTIQNNIKKGRLKDQYGQDMILDCLEKAGISPGRRGETVSVSEAVSFCIQLCHKIESGFPS